MIKGYRELSDDELIMINKLKDLADIVGQTVTLFKDDKDIDQRWLAMATTDLQKGFMAAVRAVAQPTTF